MDLLSPLASHVAITPADQALEAQLRARIDGKAKPPGSLGRIEELAIRLGVIQGSPTPRAETATLLLFAGDHGLCQEGVSAYPQAVTTAMVATFLAGRAAASCFAANVGASVVVVDAGVAADLSEMNGLVHAKVREGTRNAAREPALTTAEVDEALDRGAAEAIRAIRDGADIVLIGEMGIGNTASSALLMHRLLPAPLALCIGQGAGHDEAGLARKRAAIERAADRSAATEPREVLREFGGLEIVMMAGAIMAASAARRPVVVDGFIASVAALAAIRLAPEVERCLVFAHRSAEAGHDLLLRSLGATPLLDLGLRLGEGTGGLLALPLLRAATAMLSGMATLDEVLAGASGAA